MSPYASFINKNQSIYCSPVTVFRSVLTFHPYRIQAYEHRTQNTQIIIEEVFEGTKRRGEV